MEESVVVLLTLSLPHETGTDGVTDQSCHIVDVEPLHELGPMGFDSLDIQLEAIGNIFRIFPFRNRFRTSCCRSVRA